MGQRYERYWRIVARQIEATWSAPLVAQMVEDGLLETSPIEVTRRGRRWLAQLSREEVESARAPASRRTRRIRRTGG